MAQYNVNIDYISESGFSQVTIGGPNGGTTSGDRLTLTPNDTIRFYNNDSSAANITGVSTARFTASSVYVSANNSGTLTVKSSPTFGNDSATIYLRDASATLYIEVVNPVDRVPDSFDIGQPVYSADLNTVYNFAAFIVKGINAATNISAYNCSFRKGGSSSWVTSSTVNADDLVYVRSTSSSNHEVQTSCSINIGGTVNSNTIQTKRDPVNGDRIYFPKTTRPVSLRDLTVFFAAPIGHSSNPPRYMSAFRRGGDHVPNIPENSSIADTSQANNNKLGDFLGSATTLYFDRYPSNKSDLRNTIGGHQIAKVEWNAFFDWSLGYSPLTKHNVQYRFVITEYSGFGLSQGVTFSSNSGSPGTYSANNEVFEVKVTSSGTLGREFEYKGKVTIYMRSIIDSSVILTTEAAYTLQFYGA
jgi:hypothetical protein